MEVRDQWWDDSNMQIFRITVDNRNLSLETMKAVDVAQRQSIASQAQDHELNPSTKN